jgi:methionine-rich copper-binding protein CopC
MLLLAIIVITAVVVAYNVRSKQKTEVSIEAPEKIEPVAEEAAEKPVKKAKVAKTTAKKAKTQK